MATKKPVAKPATKKVATKPVARPAVKKAPTTPAVATKAAKVVQSDVEISPPFVMTDKWTFKCNGEVVSKAVFDSIQKDHEAFVIEQAKAALAADMPEKKTRKKK
jgi:hypothetical protein